MNQNYKVLVMMALCALFSNDIFSANTNWTWNGATSTSWTTKTNWTTSDGDAAVGAGDTVIFNSGNSVYPSLGANRSFAKLVMNGGSFTYGGFTLTVVYQLVLNSGTFTIGNNQTLSAADVIVNNGTLEMNANETVDNVTINGGTFDGSGFILTVSTDFILNNGTADFTGSELNINDDMRIFGGTLNVDGNDIDVADDLVLDGGLINIDNAEFDVENNIIIVSGTLNLHGENIDVANEYEYQGGTISNPGIFNVDRLIVNLSGSYAPNYTIDVRETADFQNGILLTSATNILIFDFNATVSGADDASHVNGPVRKEIATSGTNTFSFPIGNGIRYAPLEISSYAQARTNDYFTAQYFNNRHTNAGDSIEPGLVLVSQAEYWMLDRSQYSGTATTDAFVRLSFNETNRSGLVDNANQLRVVKWDGVRWVNQGNTSSTGNNTAGTVRSSAAVTSFSPFTLGSTNVLSPLPITLLNFTASEFQKQVLVQWSTVNEYNNDFFTVEKSLDGKNWSAIGTVKAHNNANEINNYQYNDAGSINAIQFYRLKQTDLNGVFTYTNIVSVKSGNKPLFSLYPNPSSSLLNVNIENSSETEVNVSIFNMDGRKVMEVSGFDAMNSSLDIQNLESGVYTIVISVDGNQTHSNFIKS